MSAIDDLMSSGSPTAKFAEVGDTVKGVITKVDKVQATEIDGTPKTYKSGDPIMQFVFTLATDERDPDRDDDDGTRRIYTSYRMEQAIKAAIKEAGIPGDKVEGSTLAVKYVGDGEPTQRGFSPPKLYKAEIKVGTSSAANDLAGSDDEPLL